MSNSRLKESNIEWLGKIPDNWKTIKFNALYDLRNEKVSDKDFPPLSVPKWGLFHNYQMLLKLITEITES